MAKGNGIPRSNPAKTAKSAGAKVLSKSGKALSRSGVSLQKVRKVTVNVTVQKVHKTPHGKLPLGSGPRTTTGERHRVPTQRPVSPVEQAARDGVAYTTQEDGTRVANDADVLRVARAVAEYRKGLMDRLAK